MALWRDRVAGQQLLLVLDDAAGSDQVRPLLPGTGGSLVLVTSRRHLTALEDARRSAWTPCRRPDAAELLVRLAARPGLDAAVTRPWPRSPGCAGTCRWRSACWPASCTTTRPGRPPMRRRPGRRARTGWS